MSEQYFKLFLAPKPGTHNFARFQQIADEVNVGLELGYFDDDEVNHKDDQYGKIMQAWEALDADARDVIVIRAKVLRVEYLAGNEGKIERVVFDD